MPGHTNNNNEDYQPIKATQEGRGGFKHTLARFAFDDTGPGPGGAGAGIELQCMKSGCGCRGFYTLEELINLVREFEGKREGKGKREENGKSTDSQDWAA